MFLDLREARGETELGPDGRTVAISDMSSPISSCHRAIGPEIEAEIKPPVKAFVAVLIDHHETRIADLESQIHNPAHKTPRCRKARNIRADPKRTVRDSKKRKRGGRKGHQWRRREPTPRL